MICHLSFFETKLLTFEYFLVSGKPYGDDNNDLYANDDYEDAETTDQVSTNPPFIVVGPKR